MSTKVAENCPRCDALTSPIDTFCVFCGGRVPVRVWRFECVCGWTWANELQREHNSHEFSKMHKAVNGGMYA